MPHAMYFPRQWGIGTVVSGSKFRNGRLSGLVLQSPCVLVENCTFEHICDSGIRIGALGDCKEGPPPYNVLIRNCRISDCRTGIASWIRMYDPERAVWSKELASPTLLCGGDSAWNTRHQLDFYNSRRGWAGIRPSGGCAYEEAWGDGHWGDLTGTALADERMFLANLFNRAILNAYYNRSRAVRHYVTQDEYVVERQNGVVATVFRKDRTLTVVDNGRTVVSAGDFFFDFPYGGGTILAYSERGCNREFRLPLPFASERTLAMTIWPDGKTVGLDVSEGRVRFVLEKGTSALIRKTK